MKVLFLTSRYAPHGRGGAERVARTLAAAMRDLGHEVVVLTTAGRHEENERLIDGIRVRAVALRNVYDLSTELPSLALKPIWHLADSYNLPMQAAVARIVREERPDVVHTHLITGFSASAWAAARSGGTPIVHTLHDHYVLCARSTMALGGVPCATRHLECAILTQPRFLASRIVDWVVGVSRYVLSRHEEYGAFAGSSSSIIPNPCHLVGSALVRVEGPTLRLGYMARLEHCKGIESLLEATNRLDGDWKLRIAGTGDPRYVLDLRRRFGDSRVEFVGMADPAEFLSSIDVMVVPSLVPETFGLSAAEALATGIPVIASNRGALPELVAHGTNGFVYDAESAGALRSAIIHAMAHRGELVAMANACRASVAALSTSRVAAQYEDVYRAVIG